MSRKKQVATAKHNEEASTQAVDNDSGSEPEDDFKPAIAWHNVFLFVLLHSAIPFGVHMIYTQWPWRTLLWMVFLIYAGIIGVTAGTHRLWSHRSYKARYPLQLLLMALQTMAGQNCIYIWCRDHRVHHKFSETNADPHNIKRGFFFAHMGWLCCRKHPDVAKKGALIDMSDLEANPVVRFQRDQYWWLSFVFSFLAPVMVPVLCWEEKFWTSFVISFMWRYIISLHGTWLVNSAAHYHGTRPYDANIEARESPVVIWTGVGEGFHNYHHTYPFDYSTSEYGAYYNLTTGFIDLMAAVGLAYDRRKVDEVIVRKRQERTGEKAAQKLASQTASSRSKIVEEEESDELDDGIEMVAESSSSYYIAKDQTEMKFTL